MRLCKLIEVDSQSECNERAHRSKHIANKRHPERSVTESKDLGNRLTRNVILAKARILPKDRLLNFFREANVKTY